MKYCSGHIKYLIAIKELSDKEEDVKCADIARHLGVSRPCVSKTMRCMANAGLVYEDFGNNVVLTSDGEEAVEEIYGSFSEVYVFFHNFLRLPHDEAHAQALVFVTSFPQDTCRRLEKLVKRTVSKKK